MIARIHLQGTYVDLEKDGVWSSPVPIWAEFFNSVFSSQRYPPTPAAGVNPFANQARAAVQSLALKIEWAMLPPGSEVPEGLLPVVY